jgi:hypothetical protein
MRASLVKDAAQGRPHGIRFGDDLPGLTNADPAEELTEPKMPLSIKQEHLLRIVFDNLCAERSVYPDPSTAAAAAILNDVFSIACGLACLPASEQAAAGPMFAEFKRLAHFEDGDDGQPFEAWLADMESRLLPHPGFT